MKKGINNKLIMLISIVFFSLAISLQANVAFQNGWDREPIDINNKNAADLTDLLQGGECPAVGYFADEENRSAVVARGLHNNENDPRLHYTVRTYDCATDELRYDGYVLKCDDWAGTYHVLNDGTCP